MLYDSFFDWLTPQKRVKKDNFVKFYFAAAAKTESYFQNSVL